MNKTALLTSSVVIGLVLAACGGGSGSQRSASLSTNSVSGGQEGQTPSQPATGNDTPTQGTPNQPSPTQELNKTAFTLAVIPDTQFYSQKHPEIFKSQTKWIKENYKQENIKFTVHLGDIVQNEENTQQWKVAVDAMGNLDGNPETPYSILTGNHDIRGWGLIDMNIYDFDDMRPLSSQRLTQYFPPSKQEQFDTFQGVDPKTGVNSYHIFKDDDGERYIVFALDWRASETTIQWVKDTLASYPNLPAILTTHELLKPSFHPGDNDTAQIKQPQMTPNGKRMWDKLIKSSDQIFISFNGHWHGEGYTIKKNDCGRDSILVVVDYQSGKMGGNGLLQLVTFNKPNNQLDFRSYSPFVANIPKPARTSEDEEDRWIMSLDFNFKERLNNFKQSCTAP